MSASLQRRYLPGDRRGSRADQPAVPDYPFPDALIHYLSLLPNDPLTMKILGDGQATGLPNKSSSFSSSITSKQLFIQQVHPLGASLQLLHLHHAPESSSRIHHRCATRNVLLCVNNTFKRHFNSSHCRPVLTIQLHTTHRSQYSDVNNFPIPFLVTCGSNMSDSLPSEIRVTKCFARLYPYADL